MKIKTAGRAVVIATAAFFAIATMSGAFALPPVQDEFMQCLDNATGGDPDGIDIAKRISCCRQAGGSWVELYDADGNVVDAFCDGAEEVYEPEEESVRGGFQINPAVLDNVVSGAVIATNPTPTPAADAVIASEGTGSDEPVLTADGSDPTPAPAQPAPEKIKRKHRHHRRHR